MALGLSVVGRVRQLYSARAPTAQELLHEVERWLEAGAAAACEGSTLSGAGGSHVLGVRLHPAAEPLTFAMPRPGVIVASAITSAAGPGYHEYVCGLLAAAGRDLAIAWTVDGETYADPTGYFETQDRAALEAHMTAWLGASMGRLRRLRAAGARDLQFSLPPGIAFVHESGVATPLGPRDDAWIEMAADDPASALEVFPWWSASLDARYFLGRALCRMWTEVYWRPPIDQTEAATMRAVLDDLDAAAALDPALPFPDAERSELLGLLGGPVIGGPPQAAAARGPIGYRRGSVRVNFGRWSVTVPGAFALTPDGSALRGTDGLRELAVSSVPAAGARSADAFLAANRSRIVPAGSVPKRLVFGAAASEAGVEASPGGPILRAHAWAAGRALGLEIRLAGETDLGWALDVWRSIRFHAEG